jgi:hypothetical protein
MRFALPFTTGTKPGVADYLPATHGLPGFAVPVERTVPALVPYLELDDGRTIVAADGADDLSPSADERGVRAAWRNWAVVGGKAGERADPGIHSDVEWRLEDGGIVRTERLSAARPVRLRRWRVVVPTTGSRWQTTVENGARTDTFDGPDGQLGVTLTQVDWPYTIAGRATGDSADGRGARGAVPLLLEFEARDITVGPAAPKAWTMRLTGSPGHQIR